MSDQIITSLIEKLEGAEGPSIALDAEICWTLERDLATSAFWRGAMGRPGPLPDEFSRLPRGLGMASLEAGSPNYTASLDAALALAERVLNTEAAINLLFEIADAANLGAHHISDLPRLLCARVLRAQPSGETREDRLGDTAVSNEAPTDARRLVHELAAKGADTPGCDNWRAVSMCRQIVEVLDKAAPASPLPGGGDIDWQDKAEGLESDLRQAVLVAWKRGAEEWCRLNYPQWVDWLEACHAPAAPTGAK